MGKHVNKKHSDGMNDFHEKRLISAFEKGDGYELDTAVHSVTGTRRAIRRRAEAAFVQFIKKGGEIPIPAVEHVPPPPSNYGKAGMSDVQLVPIE